MIRTSFLPATLAVLMLAACQSETEPRARVAETPSPAPAETRGSDPHSMANDHQVRVRHLALDLTVDFEARQVKGWADLDLDWQQAGAESVVLDTRGLSIARVLSGDQELAFQLDEAGGEMGSALRIEAPGQPLQVRVEYASDPGATGLQWLDPVQTAGGEHPFLFTQSQAIHARSWIPLQDTPRVRFTYQARIRTPEALRAVMSAHNDPEAPRDGDYHFDMPQAIPSYLMALAVGDLAFQAMSERTGVYAEPSVVAAAASEFEDTEAMMQQSEALFGPYRWGRYDLLILPPSFPFGGMENPRLSFITPTVIAGDKSLVALIAHELAHSWSGNLVTNATWNDLWLNEGFTVYLEARIMEAVFSAERRAMEDVLGYESLMREMATLPEAEQHLVVVLDNPDDAFSNVPYEKGRLLLVWLEQQVGREAFDAYLRGYFDEYGFQSLSTDEFLVHLQEHLLANHPQVSLDQVRQWIYAPGLPGFAVLPESDAMTRVEAQREQWVSGSLATGELETGGWTVHEWLGFLNNLPVSLSQQQLAELDAAFGLTGSRNAEIAHSWLLLSIRSHYRPAFERLDDYLTQIGRRKLIEPLYRALMEQSWGRDMAREIYQRARPGYHPQAAATLDRVVLQPGEEVPAS